MDVTIDGQAREPSGRDDVDVADQVQRLARELLPRIADLTLEVADSVMDAVPELIPTGSDEEIAAIRESTEQNVGAILSMLAYGVVPGAAEPPLGTVKVVRQTVAGGGDLVTMLRAFRMGHQAVSALWLEHVSRSARTDVDVKAIEVARVASERLFTYFDGVSEQLAARYRRDHPEERARDSSSQRRALDGLLTDDDPDVAAASLALGYDVRAHHLGIVTTLLDRDADAHAAVKHLASEAGGTAVLSQAVSMGTTWAWIGSTTPFPEEHVDALSALEFSGLRIAVGESERGVTGFRRTHEQAIDAERYARIAARTADHVHLHRRVELAGILCADPVRARRLADARLGALAARSETVNRLRETLSAYLSCGRNKARAGEVLHVHQKTVAYRLARVEALLGGPLPDDCSELEVALLIDRTLDSR